MLYLCSLLNLSSSMRLNDLRQKAIASSMERPSTWQEHERRHRLFGMLDRPWGTSHTPDGQNVLNVYLVWDSRGEFSYKAGSLYVRAHRPFRPLFLQCPPSQKHWPIQKQYQPGVLVKYYWEWVPDACPHQAGEGFLQSSKTFVGKPLSNKINIPQGLSQVALRIRGK